MTKMRALGTAAALGLSFLAELSGCAEPPAPALVQSCIQQHLDQDPISRIGLAEVTVMEPRTTSFHEVGGRVECDVTAPVISKTIVGTESTTTTGFRVHFRKSEDGYACAAVERR